MMTGDRSGSAWGTFTRSHISLMTRRATHCNLARAFDARTRPASGAMSSIEQTIGWILLGIFEVIFFGMVAEKLRRSFAAHKKKGLELLAKNLKRLVVKDSAVNTICHGAKLVLSGLARPEPDVAVGEEVALVTRKGETVALGVARMTTADMAAAHCEQEGVVANINRVIMDRDTYPLKQHKSEGLLTREKKSSSVWQGELATTTVRQVAATQAE